MPIYIKFDGVQGTVKPADPVWASGGVWKTTNFLTTEPVGPTASGSPGVGFLRSMDGGQTWASGAVPLSRISLVSCVGGVDGRDPIPTLKARELFETARSRGNGNLQITQYYAGQSQFDGQGRLLVGTDGGLWRSGRVQDAANRMRSSNNLKQIALACHHYPAVEIFVHDTGNPRGVVLRLSNVRVEPTAAGISLNFTKIEFKTVGMGNARE